MGRIVGEPFEDFGNTLEYTVGAVRAFERLPGDRVRVYVTEERGEKHILLYTFVAATSAFAAFGKRCFEIAECNPVLPDWALESRSKAAN